MCGICGIYNFSKNTPVNPKVLETMNTTLTHRGPDDAGYHLAREVGLGVRRLSVIDLEGGHQPIHNENRDVWIVFNGEIYNYLELAQECTKRNHVLYTKTDTEVIVHLYEDFGLDCLRYLRGMFAFAIWDENKKRLFIARDRVGKKPLFYWVRSGTLVFASEIKAILPHPEVTKEIHFPALDEFLSYGYIHSPSTIFRAIKSLPPASFLTCDKNGPSIKKYWELDFSKKIAIDPSEAQNQILNLLTESVKIRLRSDVPLGVFLSGGLDSSAIVAVASKLINKPLETFSIGFVEQGLSELRFAKIVADHFKTTHREFIVRPEILKILPEIVWHYDQPFADSSAIASYYLAKVTRNHVTVALNGDGGDENFAGYDWYKAGMVADLVPHAAAKFLPKKYSKFILLPSEKRGFYIRESFDSDEKESLYSPALKRLLAPCPRDTYIDEQFHYPALCGLDRMLLTDIQTYLPDDLLVKMDIATMSNSLEVRSPLLDQKLLEFTATLPAHFKLRGFTSKYIFRKICALLLPPVIIKRKKAGFGVPIGKWLRKELAPYLKETLLSSQALRRDYFNKNSVVRMINEHLENKANHGSRLWALIVLETWHRVFMDNH